MPGALCPPHLIAEPGRRRATLDTAREIERRGFAGIAVSSSCASRSHWRQSAFDCHRSGPLPGDRCPMNCSVSTIDPAGAADGECRSRSGVRWTRRWSEADSNPPSHLRRWHLFFRRGERGEDQSS
jgi:hypothetical protein